MKKKNSRSLGLLLKVTIFAFLLWTIYKHVFHEENLDQILDGFREALKSGNRSYLFIAIALMFVNWSLEALKWKVLVKSLERITFPKSLMAIFSGISLSLFTPNRIGEFGGRILYLESQNRYKGVGLTLLGSLGQYAVSFTIGAIGFMLFYRRFYEQTLNLDWLLVVGAVVIPALVFLIFFKRSLIQSIMLDKLKLRRLEAYINPIGDVPVKSLVAVLAYSAARHMVFTIQYILLINVFGIELSWGTGAILVSSIFFAQTVLPTLEFLGLFIKGELALFFLGYVTDLDLSILAAAFAIWILNLIIPAILGSLFLWLLDLGKFERDEK